MRQDKMLYVMAGFDAETEQRLSALEALLARAGYRGSQTRGIPPHITLGAFPCEQEEQVRALVANTALETAAFPLTFQHLGVFGGGRVLFAAPDVRRPLLDLKERFGSSARWTAHATLLIDEPERVVTAFAAAIQAFDAFEGRVERLYLHECFPNRKILHAPLRGS